MKYFKQKSRKNKKKFFFVLNKNTPYDTPPKKLKKKKNLKVNTNYNVTYSNLQNTNKKTNKNTENKTKYNKNVINHYNKKNIANNTIKI